MNLAQRLTEARPSVEWHIGRLTSQALYRRSFGSFGPGSVIVRPRTLRGVDRIHVGSGVVMRNGVWLQCEDGGGPLFIGDNCTIGYMVHLHAADPIHIGAGCVIAEGSLVTTADHMQGVDRRRGRPSGAVTIGHHVFIGQGTVILGGVSIGDGATIGAGSVVTHDVPPGATAVGVPARVRRVEEP